MAGVRRTRNWIVAAAAVGVLGGAGLVGVGMMRDSGGSTLPLAGTFSDAGAQASGRTAPVTAQATPTPSPTRSGPTPAQVRAARVKALDAALKKYAASAPEFSVAVLDRRTGQRYSFRGAEKY